MPYVVGLTGGIGSGKSEVARAFALLGAEVADADVAAHAVSARGQPGYDAVVATFGREAVAANGELDRAWLRDRVFADARARAQLESLLHPLIGIRLEADIAQWRAPYGLLVVPLLLERGRHVARVARVLVVDCPEEAQVRRVMARSGLADADVRAIMATQLSREARLARADDVIDNGGRIEALAPQVDRLHALYTELARGGALEAAQRSPDNGAHSQRGRT